MARWASLLALVALTVVALVGCRTARHPPASGEADTDQLLLTKLDGYQRCIAEHAARVFQIADAYRDSLADASTRGPTVIASEDPEACLYSLLVARFMMPSLPELETSGDAFAHALVDVYQLTRDGNARRGATPRDDLLAAFAAFDRAEADLFDRVYQLNRDQRAKTIAQRAERDGKTYATETDAAMLRGEELIVAAATPWDKLESLDLVATTSHLEAFEHALHELASYALDHEQEMDEHFKTYPQFADHGNKLLIAAKLLVARVRDHVGYSDAEKLEIAVHTEANVVGTPAALAAAYNELVDAYGLR